MSLTLTSLALVLVTAPVRLLVVTPGPGVDDATAAALATELRDALTPTGETIIDPAPWTVCTPIEPCVRARAEAAGARELVLVHAVGGPSLLRLVSERRSAAGVALRTTELDVPRAREAWRDAADEWQRALFPESPSAAIVNAETPSPSAEVRPRRWLPWALVGGAAVALVPAALFARSSAAAVDDAERRYQRAPEHEATLARARDHALAANVSFTSAALLAIAGGLVFAFD
ncbi:hypothetical protein L6R52_02670 [Myxococcota bacterium]|nr:hypothetical protein [Myxococcota bacterium]